MAVRQGPIDTGSADAARLARDVGRELRSTRISLGLSQRFVARSAAISPSRLGRIERGAVRNPALVAVCRAGRVLGLELSAKLFPAGSPARDAGQLAVLARFEALAARPLVHRREVALPDESQRAWDGMLVSDTGVGFTECEVRIGDVQALTRRLSTKLRDDPRSSVVILVVARTAHNREILARHRETLRELLPLDGAAIARSLRAGRLPSASGIIVV